MESAFPDVRSEGLRITVASQRADPEARLASWLELGVCRRAISHVRPSLPGRFLLAQAAFAGRERFGERRGRQHRAATPPRRGDEHESLAAGCSSTRT